MDERNEAEEDCIDSTSMDLASGASLLAVGDDSVVVETVLEDDVLDRMMATGDAVDLGRSIRGCS